jgi:hypothetical protein
LICERRPDMTMLYRSTDRLCRCGASMKNLAHSASFESLDKNAPSKAGTKHLEAQVFEHTRVRFQAAWTFVVDFAHFEHGPSIGHSERKIQVLLDNEHRGSVP